MTKNEKTAAYILGGLVVVGGGVAIYFAVKPKTPVSTGAAETGAVQGGIQGGMKIESSALPQADQQQVVQQQQAQITPPKVTPPLPKQQIQLMQNLSQL